MRTKSQSIEDGRARRPNSGLESASIPNTTGHRDTSTGNLAGERVSRSISALGSNPLAKSAPAGVPIAKRKLLFPGSQTQADGVATDPAPLPRSQSAARATKLARTVPDTELERILQQTGCISQTADLRSDPRKAMSAGALRRASVTAREPFAQSHRNVLDSSRSKEARITGSDRPSLLSLVDVNRCTKPATAPLPARDATTRGAAAAQDPLLPSSVRAGVKSSNLPPPLPQSQPAGHGTIPGSNAVSRAARVGVVPSVPSQRAASADTKGNTVVPSQHGQPAGGVPGVRLLTDLCLRQSGDGHARAKAAMMAQAAQAAQRSTARVPSATQTADVDPTSPKDGQSAGLGSRAVLLERSNNTTHARDTCGGTKGEQLYYASCFSCCFRYHSKTQTS